MDGPKGFVACGAVGSETISNCFSAPLRDKRLHELLPRRDQRWRKVPIDQSGPFQGLGRIGAVLMMPLVSGGKPRNKLFYFSAGFAIAIFRLKWIGNTGATAGGIILARSGRLVSSDGR